jgi:hypothetical protein
MSRKLMTTQAEELSLQELERQDVELLPDREEMALVTVNGNGIHTGGILNGSLHFVNNDVNL